MTDGGVVETLERSVLSLAERFPHVLHLPAPPERYGHLRLVVHNGGCGAHDDRVAAHGAAHIAAVARSLGGLPARLMREVEAWGDTNTLEGRAIVAVGRAECAEADRARVLPCVVCGPE